MVVKKESAVVGARSNKFVKEAVVIKHQAIQREAIMAKRSLTVSVGVLFI